MNKKMWLLIPVVMLAMAGSCDTSNTGDSPHGDPFPAPIEVPAESAAPSKTAYQGECDPSKLPKTKPNIQKKRYVTIYTCVPEAYRPYEVQIAVRDNTTGEFGQFDEPVVGAIYEREIGYDSGHHVTMHIELKPARAGSFEGFLYVIDGPANITGPLKIDGSWRVLTDFTVAR